MNIKLQTNEQLSATVANGLAGVFVNGVSLSASLSGKSDASVLNNYYQKSETSSASQISTALSAKSTVSFSQTLTAGTSIGSITIDGATTQMYAPAGGGGGSNVYVSADYQAGTRVATIGVDSISTEIYMPGSNEIGQVDSADAADLLVVSRLSSSGTYETRALSVGALSSVFCTNDVFNAALGNITSLIHSI